MSRIKQLLELSAVEWRALMTSVLLLPLAALSLQWFGFNKTRSVAARFTNKTPLNQLSDKERLIFARQAARMVGVAANYGPYRANCLKRSLVLWALLAKNGIVADLKIGVDNSTAVLRAHAWVEFEGMALISRPAVYREIEHFKAFPECHEPRELSGDTLHVSPRSAVRMDT